MVYRRLEKVVNRVEDKLESIDYYSNLVALIQGVPNFEGYKPRHMSDYLLERIANV